ncbi:PREDICTED: protein LYK5-like [Nelumbo nucifera]|uniref:Protein LYK5-like n=2 Tax=Nelumbo nucifera TaxID=4432 RepID=A0A1U8B4L9_NELNU|nr:PREDICTED: protein LYK5-like [Nelumbo nucifera]DAD45275.1 TPA_asm: hypothetical protein HUJ06_003505 [Nelumbo nucifera]
MASASSSILSSFLFIFLSLSAFSHAQQAYLDNMQLDCYENRSLTHGYLCNGLKKSCKTYLTFRSLPPYDNPVSIAYLLGSQPSEIARFNNITDVDPVPVDTLLYIPVNCSCLGKFYQHNAFYTMKYETDTYFVISNDTYQGLTTCQAMMNQNPYDSMNLLFGMKLLAPLRCACPTKNQTARGVKFLLTYLPSLEDDVPSISKKFGVDEESINDANKLKWDSVTYPYTPILVPLRTEPRPTKIQSSASSPAPLQSPVLQNTVPAVERNSSNKWVFFGIGIGVGLVTLVIFGTLVWFLCLRRLRQGKLNPEGRKLAADSNIAAAAGKQFGSSDGIQVVIESLTVYKFEELEKVTGFFSEDHKIKGSVYRGVIQGDNAAVKRIEGNISNEINILKLINHFNVVKLSGFCVHEGNTYLVYEFAEGGPLSDWLHEGKNLGWKQRVQIAYDVANGLNYLHNYANPPYIHKNLNSSNILLDGDLRAKIANFGLARTVNGTLQLTSHVVGTQGYMAPEYLEHGLLTPKLDVFAFGVIVLELLSRREAATSSNDDGDRGERLLSETIKPVLEGENAREKLRGFMDPSLGHDYPLELAFSLAQLAMNCLALDLNSRPTISQAFISLSKILSSSSDWDSSDELQHSNSLGHGR